MNKESKSGLYRALVVREEDQIYKRSVEYLNQDQLPENDLLIRVHYSSLNYKDALSAAGNRGVTSEYPHTPGIDAAGVVEYSRNTRFEAGQKVLVTSYDLGMNTPGGFAEYISVPEYWVVPLPENLSLKESMIFGTAGFTAAYGVMKIIEGGVSPDLGEVVVTGATGGVGSMAVALLAQQGFKVVAVTGKDNQKDFLLNLGAAEVADRSLVDDQSKKQLLKSRWAAAFDTTGSYILDTVIRQTAHNGIIVCCGNVLGHQLHTNIYPFILRGVSLMGIDSGITLMAKRLEIWEKLSKEWKLEKLNNLYREVSLNNLSDEIDKILEGRQRGRVIVNLLD